MKSVLEPLMNSPSLPDYADEIGRTPALERQRRERFYEEVTEEGEFEFINGEVIVQSPRRTTRSMA